MTLAYALTGHKAQGLNMKVTYIVFDGIFWFGLPYTLITRTPFVDNIYYVGVNTLGCLPGTCTTRWPGAMLTACLEPILE